jgi:sugar lactone lactonase YvrE
MSVPMRAALIAAACLCLSLAALAQQTPTLERVAGGATFVDAPGHTVPATPASVAVGPDGLVYFGDWNMGRLLRLDPATQTVTALPGVPDSQEFEFSGLESLAFDPEGALHFKSMQLIFRLNPNLVSYGQVPNTSYSSGQFAFHSDGSLYMPDAGTHTLRVLRPWGQNQLLAGNGQPGFEGDGGPASLARFHTPRAVAVDAAGNVFIADRFNHRVRRIDVATGIITTFAGNGSTTFNGDGIPATDASVRLPTSLAFDGSGNLYVTEDGDGRVRRVDAVTGLISTFAGDGTSGFSGDGGPATAAQLSAPAAIAFDANDNLYIADGNARLRRVDAATGIITTVVGNGTSNYCRDGAAAVDACLHFPLGLAFDAQQNLAIADAFNGRVRQVAPTTGVITTLTGNSSGSGHGGDGGPAFDAGFGTLAGLDYDASGNLYIAAWFDNRIRRVDAATGVITTFVGTGTAGPPTENVHRSIAITRQIADVILDTAGNLYFSDTGNNRVRRVDAITGNVTTVAGRATPGPLGDGGPATNATLNGPEALAFDANGHLLIADRINYRIRRVNLSTGIITTVAGTGSATGPANNVLATSTGIGAVEGLAIDAAGNIFASTNGSLSRIDAATQVLTLVSPPFSGPQTADGESINSPMRLAFDASGRLYVSTMRNRVFRLSWNTPPTDTTPPVIQVSVSGTAGNAGWYRSDVIVTWSVDDPESPPSSAGCGTSHILSDTTGITLTCSASSAGGTATQSVTIRRDASAPYVLFGATSPAANSAGWNNTDVSQTFTIGDGASGSGIESTSTVSPLSFTGEGLGITRDVTVTDVAGNSATYSRSVNIDRTAPQLDWPTPAAGALYGAFSTVTAQYTCSDSLSGIATCSGTAPSGAPIATNVPGNFNFQVDVYDNAGVMHLSSRGYSVAPLVFERFIEPLRRSPTFNGVTAGSLVPIRWRLLSAGQAVTNPAAFQSISVFNQACQGTPVPLNDTAIGGAGLSVNPANGYFTYNWQTDASWAGTCRRVQIRFSDNSVREVVFRLN